MSDSERSFAMKEVAPLPWRSHKIPGTRAYRYRLVDADDLAVLFVPGKEGAGTGDRAKEIAEYVLHAANSHEELLEAAKLALYWLRSHPDKPASSMHQIDEAIAKATKGERSVQ